MVKIDLTGMRFGYLVAVREGKPRVRSNGDHRRTYDCNCDCGKDVNVLAFNLSSGHTKSCGCVSLKLNRQSHIRHGHTKNREVSSTYRTWAGMKSRCLNPRSKFYRNYGGRGIQICDRWLGEDGFQNFIADMGNRPNGATIDRINNNGNYEPGNCRWATRAEQNNNYRRNKFIWTGEIFVTMKQFANAFGIPYERFRRAYRDRGMTVQEILIKEDCLL